jgi:hypothetical protein
MWSREDEAIGVSLLTLDGRVVATVPNVILFDSDGPTGRVILRSEDETRYWLLDPSAHELLPITLGQANWHHRTKRVLWPTPARSWGYWAWTMPAPNGSEVLAQYYQNGYGPQVSECATPVAMLQVAPDVDPAPVTGEPLA